MTLWGQVVEVWAIVASATGLAGLVLLIVALVGDRSRGRRRCPSCWYSMSGTPGLVCPECGRDARSERRLLRTRRRWRLGALAILILLGSGGGYAYHIAARDGAWALVPFTVGMHMLPWYEKVPLGLSESLRGRLQEGPIREWQRRHLYGRAGVILESPGASKDAKMLALRLIEGVSWRGGYNGSSTGEAGEAWPTLVAALDDAEPMVRKFSAGLLGTIGGDTEAIFAAVVPMMDSDANLEVRMDAVGSVGQLAKTPSARTRADVLDRLRRAYAGGDEAMKSWCVDAAGKLVPVRADAVAWLIELAASDDPHLVISVCQALRKAGSAAAPADAALARIVAGTDRTLAAKAAAALKAIGAGTPVVHDGLLAGVRRHAGVDEVFIAFETLFRERAGASDELIKAASTWSTEQAAFGAANACDDGADPAKFLPLFEKLIRSGATSNPKGSRTWAGVYKWTMVAPTRDASLLKYVDSPAPPTNGVEVWRAALRGRLAGDDAATVDLLLGVLTRDRGFDSAWTRSCAADAAGYFGEEARRTLPTLKEMVEESAWEPSERAREAIGRITGTKPPRPR